MPYFIVNILIILLALSFNANNTSARIRNVSGIRLNREGVFMLRKDFLFAISAAFVLTIFMGFRNNFSTDHDAYLRIFHQVCTEELTEENLSFKAMVEPGYLILNRIIGLVSENDLYFMTVIAALIVYMTVSEAYAETTNIFWFILLYFNTGTYLMGFNGMRQALAAAITYYGTGYLRKGYKKHFIITVLLAFTIHRTSLFMLAILPFMLMKVNLKNVSTIIISGILFFALMEVLVNVIQNIFPAYSRYHTLGEGESIITVITQWLMFLFCCMAVRMRKLRTDSLTERILFNGSLLFVIVTAISLKFGMIVRLKYFMSMYLVALFANAINSVLHGRSMLALRFLLIVLILCYLYVRIIHGRFGEYVFLG